MCSGRTTLPPSPAPSVASMPCKEQPEPERRRRAMAQQVARVEVMYNEGGKAKQFIAEDVGLKIDKYGYITIVHDALHQTWFPQDSVCYISFELPAE